MAEDSFDEKEKEVLGKWQHWKDYIDSLEGQDTDKNEEMLLKLKRNARPAFKGCGHCIRGH